MKLEVPSPVNNRAMDRLQSLRVFQEVVDEGSFAAAARKLALAPAVVTRLVGDLEQHLGTRLLERTTRSLSLTPAGEEYLARVRAVLADLDEADAMAQAHAREMRGTVRVFALPVIASSTVAPAIAEFRERHPGVHVDIHVSDSANVDVEQYDISLLGDAQVHSSAIVRTILEAESILCASPAYLARHGEPGTPEDLQGHQVLRFRPPGGRMRPWEMVDPADGGRVVEVDVRPVLTVNHPESLMRAAMAGAGIASLATRLVAPALAAGELRRVLAPWITGRVQVIAALPSREYMPARTRAFLDHLIEHARRSPPAPAPSDPPAPALR